jgi:hypothetical protein
MRSFLIETLYGIYRGFLCVKGRVIPVTVRGGPLGCEMLRFPHFLNNRLTDGGKVLSLTSRPPFTPQEDSWYLFLLRSLVDPRAIVRLEGLGKLTSSVLESATSRGAYSYYCAFNY